MEARATNPIYRTGESHPCPSYIPPAPTMDGNWNRRVGAVIPEFTSKGKLVWGLILPTITNRHTDPKVTNSGAL